MGFELMDLNLKVPDGKTKNCSCDDDDDDDD